MTNADITRKPKPNRAVLPLPVWEFVCLIASLMALNALAIDTMLPALAMAAEQYDLLRENDQQLIIFAYVAGFGVPQLVFGPVSDRYGRKGLLLLCLLGYVLFGGLCMVAPSFTLLLAARFFQGVCASGIRVIAVSIVRDLTEGRNMARIMSLVMTIFMVVPIMAPQIGVAVMWVAPWQWTFGILSIAGLLVVTWTWLRLPETLAEADRQPLNFKQSFRAYKLVVTTRITFGYMAASGVIFGALFSFIAASPQIFTDVFDQEETYTLWFAGIAGFLAAANFMNSALVEKLGMRRISHFVLITFLVLTLINLVLMEFAGEKLIYFFPLFCLTFGCFGMMGANFSAMAMEPLGKIAGTASAAYGFATTTVASIFGAIVAGQFNGHVTPFLWGFVGLGLTSLIIILITERGKLFEAR